MRRLGHRAQGAEQARKAGHETAKREPLAEGIRKGPFSAQEVGIIRQKREELLKGGLTDRAISEAISAVLPRAARNISNKIGRMVESGELPENPNKREIPGFSPADIATITRRRAALVGLGLSDGELSRVLSKELRRSYSCIRTKIHRMVESGALSQNPCTTTASSYGEEELATIARVRAELIDAGLPDKKIAAALSAELGRSANSLAGKLQKMTESGDLPENPNKMLDFSPEELALIRRKRADLILAGHNDAGVSRKIAGEIQRTASSINSKIRSMVESGEVPRNPNMKTGIPPADVEAICRRRAELVPGGLVDKKIAQLLSGEFPWAASAIDRKIRALVTAGSLPENPNRKGQRNFTEKDLETIRRTRQALIQQGLNDTEISNALSTELRLPAASIHFKIRKMLESGELPRNPNKREKSGFSHEELEKIRQLRPGLIQQGLRDFAVSKSLSGVLQHTPGSIYGKIRKMVNAGELPENPNKKDGAIPESELLGRLKEAVSLYTEVSE